MQDRDNDFQVSSKQKIVSFRLKAQFPNIPLVFINRRFIDRKVHLFFYTGSKGQGIYMAVARMNINLIIIKFKFKYQAQVQVQI
ncbi:MAG: hypothetical protein ACI8P3_004071 [Saprospiraceae bacterium]|jgi:hypothetical protein